MLSIQVPFKPKSLKLLPVVLILDCSGSMYPYMPELNQAIKGMLQQFCENKQNYELKVAIITFSDQAHLKGFESPKMILEHWQDLKAYGKSALGAAFGDLHELLCDLSKLSQPLYRPVLCLISDGMPSDKDELTNNLSLLLSEDSLFCKCERFALAIKNETDQPWLDLFLCYNNSNREVKSLQSFEPNEILNFIETVTYSTVATVSTAECVAQTHQKNNKVHLDFSSHQK